MAQNIYNSFDGSEEEKSRAVIDYLKNLENKGQKEYEKIVTKLDSILVEINDIKEIDKKQTILLQTRL